MNRSYKLIIIVALYIYSLVICYDAHSQQKKPADKKPVDKDTSQNTVTREGNFFRLAFLSDTTFKIIWGNGNSRFESDSIFESIPQLPQLQSSTNQVIILQKSCGTSCIYSIVLPLIPNAKAKIFLSTLCFDEHHNLIVYATPDDKDFIIAENYVTDKKFVVRIRNLCPAALKQECIDSISINNRKLFIKWQGKHWASDKPDPQQSIISIPI